jgi:hypothetical protein
MWTLSPQTIGLSATKGTYYLNSFKLKTNYESTTYCSIIERFFVTFL